MPWAHQKIFIVKPDMLIFNCLNRYALPTKVKRNGLRN